MMDDFEKRDTGKVVRAEQVLFNVFVGAPIREMFSSRTDARDALMSVTRISKDDALDAAYNQA